MKVVDILHNMSCFLYVCMYVCTSYLQWGMRCMESLNQFRKIVTLMFWSCLSASEAPSNMLKLAFMRSELEMVTSVEPWRTDTRPSFASKDVRWSTHTRLESAKICTVSLSPTPFTWKLCSITFANTTQNNAFAWWWWRWSKSKNHPPNSSPSG